MQKSIPSQVAEIQLTYKSEVKPSERFKVTCSTSAKDALLMTWDKDQIEFVEEFKVMLLNTANQVLGIVIISKGGTRGTVADPKLIFATALKANAVGLILAHNHPSGNLQPSDADIQLTKKLKEAGKFLEITVLDHLILTVESYFHLQIMGSCSPFFMDLSKIAQVLLNTISHLFLKSELHYWN